MGLLWLVTLIWAFSFSLIGEFLSGRVDPYLAVSSRMLLALVLFPAMMFAAPSYYNTHDFNKLQAFLNQPSKVKQ